MRILLTGANGFLGNSIRKFFAKEQVATLSRSDSNINHDLSAGVPELPLCSMVIHAAGKAHFVPTSRKHVEEFFNVNVGGTRNLLTGLEKLATLPKSIVFISTVAVYGLDTGILINEQASLQAKDPYGLSKIQAEELIQEWCLKNNVTSAILRLPLIAGPNPPGNLRSMISGIQRGYYVNIAGGTARKSMVLADEVAKILLKAGHVGGIYNLTDGCHPSFAELSEIIANQLVKSKPRSLPFWVAEVLATIGDLGGSLAPINSNKLQKVISDLTFDDSKARELLGWNPTPVLKGFKII